MWIETRQGLESWHVSSDVCVEPPIWRITTYFVLWMSIPSLMTSAVASVCCGDVGVSFLVGFIVRVVVLVILHRLQLLPCHLFWPPFLATF
jgi:hypothetical protein